jgi:hypothetical protein
MGVELEHKAKKEKRVYTVKIKSCGFDSRGSCKPERILNPRYAGEHASTRNGGNLEGGEGIG